MEKKATKLTRKGFLMPQTVKSLNLINAEYWQSFVHEEDFFVVPVRSNEIYGEISRKLKGIVKPEAIYRSAKYHQEMIKAHCEKVLGRKLKFPPTIKRDERRKPQTIALLSLISSKYNYWNQFQSSLPSRSDKIYKDLMNDPAVKEHKMSLNQVIYCIRRYKEVIKTFNNPESDSKMNVENEEESQTEVAGKNEDNDSASQDEEMEEEYDDGSELRVLRSMSSGK
jgi:hypothetical protein